MKTHVVCGALVLGLVGLAAAPNQKPEPRGVLSILRQGQRVNLKDSGTAFEIGVFEGVQLTSKVKEVGPDFLVIEDFAGITETRISIYSIKAVTVIRGLKGNQKE